MADKWVPKACDCFQRKDFGTIFVAGTTIYVFNARFELQQQIEKATYYEALQETLLMIGALDLNAITALQAVDVDEEVIVDG